MKTKRLRGPPLHLAGRLRSQDSAFCSTTAHSPSKFMALTDRVFSMNPDESLNPYAAPKASTPPASAQDLRSLRRPRSLKWAIVILGLGTLSNVRNYWLAISAYGTQEVLRQQPLLDPVFLVVLGFACSVFIRNRFSFGCIAATLAWLSFSALRLVWWRWNRLAGVDAGLSFDRAIGLLLSCGIVYLFYRFTFGLPSRRYFGVAREEERVA